MGQRWRPESVVPGVKQCEFCGETFPAELVTAGRSYCRKCVEMSAQRVAKRDGMKGAATAMVALMNQLQEGAIEKVSAVGLVSKTLRLLGGEAGLARLWAEQIQAAIERNPGSQTTLKAIKELKDAVVQVDPVMQGVNELKQMTDSEVQDFAGRVLMERLAGNKTLLAEILDQYGYGLIDKRETPDGHIAGIPRLPLAPDPPDPGVVLDAAICAC